MPRLYIVTLLIMWNARLDKAQAAIKIARRNINNLRYADDTTLRTESEEELNSFFKKVKEESEKAGLKLSIQKIKIMTSRQITSWQIEGETVTDFFKGAPKSLWMVTSVMKIKDTLWEESYDKPRQCIKKQRHYFADKDLYSQSHGFSSSHIWMWEVDHKEG